MDEETFNLLCEYVDSCAFSNARFVSMGKAVPGLVNPARERLRAVLVKIDDGSQHVMNMKAALNESFGALKTFDWCKCQQYSMHHHQLDMRFEDGSFHSQHFCVKR